MFKKPLLPFAILVLSQGVYAQQPPSAGSQIQQIPPAPTLQRAEPTIRIEPSTAPATPATDAVKITVNSLQVTGARAELAFTLLPQLGGATLAVAAFDSRWPAELLSGLGTPWNTLRLEGALALRSDGLSLQWASGRLLLRGGVGIDALDLASRLSSLRPLGSYRATLQGADDGSTAQLDLQTLRGELLLQGSGQWVGGRLRFAGDAQAAPGSEPALNNLLNIMGRRQGPRSVFNIG